MTSNLTADKWASLGCLSPAVIAALEKLNFPTMAAVQKASIAPLLAGKDVIVQAPTGSGKTLAYGVPAAEHLIRAAPVHGFCSVLIIVPTRELALQVAQRVLTPLLSTALPGVLKGVALLIGGHDTAKDVSYLRAQGCAVVVATPGRLLELLRLPDARDFLDVSRLHLLVIDEADRLLALGFSRHLTQILDLLPKQRRTALFSATQTEEVAELASAGLRDPFRVTVDVSPASQTAVPHSLSNFYKVVPLGSKISHLIHFLNVHRESKIIVYFLTCSGVEYFAQILNRVFSAEDAAKDTLPPCDLPRLPSRQLISLHGKVASKARTANFKRFLNSKTGVLLCTDVAARGLDIPDVDWVVQVDAPQDPKMFVHRIGRTARMDSKGNAVVLLTPVEVPYVEFLKIRKVETAEFPEDDTESFPASDEEAVIPSDVIFNEWRKVLAARREAFVLSKAAFISHIRGYKEHQCSYIFRFDKLNLEELAYLFCLLQIPEMTELKKFKRGVKAGRNDEEGYEKFTPFEIDPDTIPFCNAQQEEKRLAELAKLRKERLKREKKKQKKDKSLHELKKEKGKPAAISGGSRNQKWTKEEIDELFEDARLIKRAKQGKISRKACDRALGFLSDSDDDTPQKKRRK